MKNVKKGDVIENENGIRKTVIAFLVDNICVVKNEASGELTLEQIEKSKKYRKLKKDAKGDIVEEYEKD